MKKARNKFLLDKSICSCIAAIEIYNKPDFRFREEAFSILMCTAWELVLKAKLLKENGNDFNVITVRDNRLKQNGERTVKKYPKLNRSGNPMTIGLPKALELVRGKSSVLDTKCFENINLLMEIRDNAVHFVNKTSTFSRVVQEVGTATLRNYLNVVSDWFRLDLSQYNFHLMPLSLFTTDQIVETMGANQRGNSRIRNLEKFIRQTASAHPSLDGDVYNVTLGMNVKFVKSQELSAIKVRHSNDPNAIPVSYSEGDFLNRYPYDYNQLVKKIRERNPDFKQSDLFYDIKRQLEQDSKYSMKRLLDPKNPKSSYKKFYTSDMLVELETRLKKASRKP